MIINFDELEQLTIPNFRGGKGEVQANIFDDSLNKIMLGRVKPGSSIGMHAHDASSEIIYILQGEATSLCDGKTEKLSAGLCHYCPKGSEHDMINDGEEDLITLAVIPRQ